MSASKLAGEKAWQLPMDEEYKDYMKSAFADMPNIGGRYGGSITAAWFLREFADPTPWVAFRHRRYGLAGRRSALAGKRAERRGDALVCSTGIRLGPVKYPRSTGLISSSTPLLFQFGMTVGPHPKFA